MTKIILQTLLAFTFIVCCSLPARAQEEIIEYEGNKYKLTITIGAAPYQEGIELEKWVDLADEKMYLGKNNGKNQIVH